MFTGIIEEIGVITSVIKGGESARLTVSAERCFAGAKPGESIAINGVCLTVTQIRRNFAEFDLSPESLRTTVLGHLLIGEKVNLEKAVTLSTRLGGHLVTGHIDGTGEIKNKIGARDSFELFISLPSDLLNYLVPKGPLTVDGVSLTVADFRDGLVKIAVIPQTVKTTTLAEKSIGDRVNIEVDLISKYIEHHLRGEPKGITNDTLTKVGFLPLGWLDN